MFHHHAEEFSFRVSAGGAMYNRAEWVFGSYHMYAMAAQSLLEILFAYTASLHSFRNRSSLAHNPMRDCTAEYPP